ELRVDVADEARAVEPTRCRAAPLVRDAEVREGDLRRLGVPGREEGRRLGRRGAHGRRRAGWGGRPAPPGAHGARVGRRRRRRGGGGGGGGRGCGRRVWAWWLGWWYPGRRAWRRAPRARRWPRAGRPRAGRRGGGRRGCPLPWGSRAGWGGGGGGAWRAVPG